jgi:peptidoglycan/LPS O-acetylase OafA/YrhL
MKIQVLDGLRGYAALLIVLSHMPRISNTELGKTMFDIIGSLKLSYLGVDLFFILSGFLITRIIIKEKLGNTFCLRSFYLKRALRIFPIYYLTIIACGFLFSWEGIGFLAIYAGNYYFSFNDSLHPLAHTWSLAVEEHYYLLWPLVIYFFTLKSIKKYTLPIILILVIGSITAAYYTLDQKVFDSMLYMGTQFRMLSLGLGSLLAFYEQKVNKINKKSAQWILLTGILSYILVIIAHEGVFSEIAPTRVLQLFLFSTCSLFFFVFVLLQENQKNSFNDFFNNKPIKFIGKISYGIYLYHYPVFFWWGITNSQIGSQPVSIADFIPALVFVFVLASSSYWLIEKPLINYKRKLIFEIKPLVRTNRSIKSV